MAYSIRKVIDYKVKAPEIEAKAYKCLEGELSGKIDNKIEKKAAERDYSQAAFERKRSRA
ncbi:MAG: hypothetical protein KDD64_06050 [Bdellovibrionales bacterium]|nr:hypothetical protein [Bdellovibrionales bacterium]